MHKGRFYPSVLGQLSLVLFVHDSYGTEMQVLSIVAFITFQTHFLHTMLNMDSIQMQRSLGAQRAKAQAQGPQVETQEYIKL